MLKPETSRLLAHKKQIAIYNQDLDMIRKIENVKKEADVTQDIINYKLKEDVN